MNILIVDDEPSHIEAVRRAFRAAGAKAVVRAASTLREYRELVAAEPPDIALLDLNLPDGHALEALSLPPDANPFPIVIITGHGDENWAVQAMKAGAFDYIVKSPGAFADMPHAAVRALREWGSLQARRKAEEKLATCEKLAVMGRLMAEVAHELNNPLAVIISRTSFMLSRLDAKQPPLETQLETVLRNALRCKIILGGILGYGRTIGGKDELINLSDLVREAVNDIGCVYDMSAINVEWRLEPRAGAEITGNRAELLSVFINIIRNAHQAMEGKGRLRISMKDDPDNSRVNITIHDTGIGISGERLAKLFQPFTSGWKKDEGSGLGLATSLGIVERHGGRLTAESEGGKGASFTILLPCKKGETSDEKQTCAAKNTGH
ncbi:MAG: response regulator [Elusimicrobia bacterium]|nr:response regulator [Elusimicrobiota bacterium]